jgi:hypothetical protein
MLLKNMVLKIQWLYNNNIDYLINFSYFGQFKRATIWTKDFIEFFYHIKKIYYQLFIISCSNNHNIERFKQVSKSTTCL